MEGAWTKLDLSEAFTGVSSHQLTRVGHRILLSGGEDGPRTLVAAEKSLWSFESSTLELLNHVADPVTLIGHTACAIGDGLIVFGGRRGGAMGEGENETNDCFVFENGSWTVLETENGKIAPRSYHTACATSTSMFVFGGCSAGGRVNDLWRLDLISRKWYLLDDGSSGSSPCARGGAIIWASSDDSTVIVAGGFDGTAPTADTWEWKSNSSWTLLGKDLFPARSVAAFADLNGQLIVFGGEKDPAENGHLGAGSFRNDVWVFDNDKKSWTQVECVGDVSPCPRGWTQWAVEPEKDSLILIGGLNDSNERLKDGFRFQLVTK